MDRTDLSGLSDSTTYYFYVNNTEYSITTGTSPTYEDVNNLMNNAISGNGYESIIVGTSPNEDIRVRDLARRGSDSKVVMDSGTSGPDLFTALNGFTSLEEPVTGGGTIEQAEYVPVPSGGISIAGATVVDTIELIETMNGGSTTTGLATYTHTNLYSYISSGGIITSGINTVDNIVVTVASGGLAVTNSVATYSHTRLFSYTSSGGITTAGVAIYTKEVAYTSSGQTFTSGIATIYINSTTNTLITDTDGGAYTGGSPTYSLTV